MLNSYSNFVVDQNSYTMGLTFYDIIIKILKINVSLINVNPCT